MSVATNPLICPYCEASVSPIDMECSSCGRALPDIGGTTLSSDELPPPPPERAPVQKPPDDAVPGWIRWLDGALAAGVVVGAALILSSPWALDTPAEQRAFWAQDVTKQLRDPNSPARVERGPALPAAGDAIFFVDDPGDEAVADAFLSAVDFHAETKRVLPTRDVYVEPIPARRSSFVVVISHGWLGSTIRVLCFRTRDTVGPLRYRERPSFVYEDDLPRVGGRAFLLLLLGLVAARGLRMLVVTRHRQRLLGTWKAYEAERTSTLFRAKQHLDAARAHATTNDIAKALVELRLALEAAPTYAEARELHDLLVHSRPVDAGAITSMPGATTSTRRSETTLYLRVVGTPYAYRADIGADVIRIGRQRRKPHDRDGNDLVIRVPASDERTLRISRHHLEINRIARDYFVIDRSDGRTRLNGRQLVTGTPVQLTSGDRLTIAHVLTLEVSIRGTAGEGGAKIIDAQSDHGRFEFEATVGDMLTEVADG